MKKVLQKIVILITLVVFVFVIKSFLMMGEINMSLLTICSILLVIYYALELLNKTKKK